MSHKLNSAIAVFGIDIGKNSFHVVEQDQRGEIVLRQKWSRGQVEVRLANLSPCLIAMEACVGAHHLSRKLQALGHDARLMPAKYVHPYNKGHKNDFRDVEDRRLFQHCRRDSAQEALLVISRCAKAATGPPTRMFRWAPCAPTASPPARAASPAPPRGA